MAPSFTIYKGEMGLARENQTLSRENDALKRAYDALAKYAVDQGLENIPQLDEIVATSQQAVFGQSFRSQVDGANCDVVIGAPNQGAPNRGMTVQQLQQQAAAMQQAQQPAVGQPMRPEIMAMRTRRNALPVPGQRRQQSAQQPNRFAAANGMPSEAELVAAGIPIGPPGFAPQPHPGAAQRPVAAGYGGAPDDMEQRVANLEFGPAGSR